MSDLGELLYEHYFEALGEIEVEISLTVNVVDSFLVIETLSENTLEVTIELQTEDVEDAYFIDDLYVGTTYYFENYNTRIILNGAKTDINSVFDKLRVNLDNRYNTTYSAEMVITDGLNPSVTYIIDDVTDFFLINTPPQFSDVSL